MKTHATRFDRKHRTGDCRQNPQNDPDLIACIKMENERNAHDRQKAKKDLFNGECSSTHDGIDDRRPKTKRRKGHHTDRDVGVFDRSVKKDPVQSQKRPHPTNAQNVFDGQDKTRFRRCEINQEKAAREHHAIPYQKCFVHRDQTTENTGKARQKDRDM